MALLQAAVMVLVALIVTPGLLFYYDVAPKIAVLLVGTAAALAWPRRGDASRASRPFTWLAAAGVMSVAVSTALSSQPALSLFGTNWRRYGALTQAAVLIFAWLVAQSTAGKPVRARTILRGIAASGAVSALYGIAQYIGWDPILPKSAYHIGEGIWTIVRPPGTMGYVSYFATWLLAVVFLSLALASWESDRRMKMACYATAVLAAAAMLLTGTRAAMLALAAGFAVWLVGRGFRVPARAMGVAATVLLAGVAFYYSPAGWPLRSRARWFAEDRWGGARIYLWRDSLAMGVRRPLGYGPEVFTATFPRFESQDLARAYPDFLHESPHNIFLDALISEGIPGVLILAGFCWIGIGSAWRSKQWWLAAAIAAVVVSQMFTVFTMPTALVFYVAVAIAGGKKQESGVRSQESGGWKNQTWLRWLVAAVFVFLAGRLVMADRALELAKESLARGDVAGSAVQFANYDRMHWPGTGSDLWYSRACARLVETAADPAVRAEAMTQASAAGIRATRTSEEPFNAWYSLSALYARQNDFANTEKCLRAAIAARPNWFKPHWTLAQVLRLEGRLDEAEVEAATAADRNGAKNPEVAQTLDEIRAHRHSRREQP